MRSISADTCTQYMWPLQQYWHATAGLDTIAGSGDRNYGHRRIIKWWDGLRTSQQYDFSFISFAARSLLTGTCKQGSRKVRLANRIRPPVHFVGTSHWFFPSYRMWLGSVSKIIFFLFIKLFSTLVLRLKKVCYSKQECKNAIKF